jgi:hypothetical protein
VNLCEISDAPPGEHLDSFIRTGAERAELSSGAAVGLIAKPVISCEVELANLSLRRKTNQCDSNDLSRRYSTSVPSVVLQLQPAGPWVIPPGNATSNWARVSAYHNI